MTLSEVSELLQQLQSTVERLLSRIETLERRIETLTGEEEPAPVPDIPADGETYFVDHWEASWQLSIDEDERGVVGATYELYPTGEYWRGVQFNLGGGWTNSNSIHPDLADQGRVASLVGDAAVRAGLPVRLEVTGGGTKADPWVLSFDKPLNNLQARGTPGDAALGWPDAPDPVLTGPLAGTYPAPIVFEFGGRRAELNGEVTRDQLWQLAASFPGLSTLNATEEEDGAWRLDLEATAPLNSDSLMTTAPGVDLDFIG